MCSCGWTTFDGHPGGQRQVYHPDLLHFRREERTISRGSSPRVAAPRDTHLGIKAFLMCWDHVLHGHQAMDKVTKPYRLHQLGSWQRKGWPHYWRKLFQVSCCLNVLQTTCSPLSHGLGGRSHAGTAQLFQSILRCFLQRLVSSWSFPGRL